jgi:hypothetical protein
MPNKITVDLTDDVYQWLVTEAAASGISVEEAISNHVGEAKARSSQLTWQEQDLLSIFRDLNGRPGNYISVHTIHVRWGTRGTNVEYTDALTSLAAKKLIIINPAQTDVALTDAGYALI